MKQYHAPIKGNMSAGHPEIEVDGVEVSWRSTTGGFGRIGRKLIRKVTTGPLGQGIANAVGLAVAGKSLGAHYNKDGYSVIDPTIWCFTGDGCLQEGVGQEGE